MCGYWLCALLPLPALSLLWPIGLCFFQLPLSWPYVIAFLNNYLIALVGLTIISYHYLGFFSFLTIRPCKLIRITIFFSLLYATLFPTSALLIWGRLTVSAQLLYSSALSLISTNLILLFGVIIVGILRRCRLRPVIIENWTTDEEN